MTVKNSEVLKQLINQPTTIGTIATLDESGVPHAVPSPFLRLDAEGRFIHLELLETSTTHRNLLRSIWFDRPVTVSLSGKAGQVVVARGKVYKAHVSGPLFSCYYREVRETLGDADLAAVWVIESKEVIDETYTLRKAREEELHPFFKHLDRLAATN
jgi:hypothetical protein